MKSIYYKEGYKYQLNTTYSVETGIISDYLVSPYLKLADGTLTIAAGYTWDGPSGIAIDTKNFMRGSLVHDALYQLMRMGKLDEDKRKKVDRLLRAMIREDGMSSMRAWWVYTAVRKFGSSSASPENLKPIIKAP